MTAGSALRTAPRFFARRSLNWRLPLLMSAVIALVVLAFLWVAQRTLEGTLLRAGRERASAAAQEIAGRLAQGFRGVDTRLGQTQNEQAVREFFREPSAVNRELARETLVPADAPAALRRIELWSLDGTLLLEIASPRPSGSPGLSAFPRGSPPSSAGVTRLLAAGEFPYFEITKEISDPSSGTRLGYLRQFGQLTASGPIRRLLGDDADLRVGSDEGVWSDFTRVVDAPAAQDPVSVGGLAQVEATPWSVWVAYPRSTLLEPARASLLWMIAIACVLTAAGGLLGAIAARRITRPIVELSETAQSVTGGDFTRRVAVRRSDEIGTLERAFNVMTSQLEHDRAAQHAAEDALRVREAGFRALFADNPLPMWVYDAETLQFLEVNEAAVRHYGFSRDEFLSMRITDIRPPEDVPRLLDQIATRRTSWQRTGNWRHRVKSGEVRDVEINSHTLPYGGRAGVLVVVLDVTERKRVEAQFLQAQKMEAIGQLTGGVAHDFNNLLTGILGYCDLLLDAMPAGDPRRADVEEIKKAGESAATLTARLLAFSRRQVVEPKVLDLNAVVGDMGRLLERVVGEDVSLALRLPPNAGRVRADPGQLSQVLMNLAVNARDAMPTGGKLTIETAGVTLDEEYAQAHVDVVPGPYVMLAVTDTGIGMTPEVQSHLFEPFFTTKALGQGTGLGLASVYGIVKQSGGSIWIYSEPGVGSTFKIYLPRVDEPVSVDVPRQPRAGAPAPATILVAEDNPALGSLARRILDRHGYTVLVAESPDEALRIAREHAGPIHLLLSDVVMPDLSGPALASAIRAVRPHIRVLHMSGYTSDAVVRHGIIDSMVAFIQKPFSPEALLQKVRSVLETESAE